MDKNKKKELRNRYVQEKKNALKNSIPFEKALFKQLFDYIDEMLENEECDETLKFTTKFLNDNSLPVEKSLEWMRENGGYCDCEILSNIEDKILEL